MAIDTVRLSAPLCGVIIRSSGRLPKGFLLGAYAPQNGNDCWYVIRNSDGVAVVCHSSPCQDEILPRRKLEAALHAACDAAKPQRGRPPVEGEAATGHIHIRTTLARKSAYVRAAKPKKLTDWIVEHLDKASDYTPAESIG